MLEVCRDRKQPKVLEPYIEKDTIVKKLKIEHSYNDKGDEIIQRKFEEVNVTKKVNETAKAIKEMNAEETLAEMEKIFVNRGN